MRSCGVSASQESLNLDLIADFALAEPDHVALVEDEQADVVEKTRIVPEREIQFLGCGNHDVALADGILVESADPDAPVERGDGLSERSEGALQGYFRLRRECSQRCHEDDPPPRRKASEDA